MLQKLNDLIKKANTGDIEAQLLLAYIYQYGDDADHSTSESKNIEVDIDLNLAEKWYLLAAEHNSITAQFNLAELNIEKLDLESNKAYSKARYWYEKAACQGDAKSQAWLADLYERGEGGEIDLTKAIFWYEKAANNGWSYAKFKLAFFYATGREVKINHAKAIKLYEESYKENVIDSAYELAYIYEKGLWTNINIEKSQKLYQKASTINYIPALLRLAKAYQLGELGLERNEILFLKYLERAKASTNCVHDNSLEDWELKNSKK